MIKAGSTGPDVKTWQQSLSNIGYKVTVDGSFGPQTLKATILFQRQHGLADDGVVWASSWNLAIKLAEGKAKSGFIDERDLADIYDPRTGKVVGRLRKEAANDWNRMARAAWADGVLLLPTSMVDSYRPPWVYKTASAIKKIAAGIMAKAGRSRHNKAEAVDADLKKKGAETWLHKNAAKYNWFWGERRDEPWHWCWAHI